MCLAAQFAALQAGLPGELHTVQPFSDTLHVIRWLLRIDGMDVVPAFSCCELCSFSIRCRAELALLHHCLPGAVHFMEPDARVSHAAGLRRQVLAHGPKPAGAQAAGGTFNSMQQLQAAAQQAGGR